MTEIGESVAVTTVADPEKAHWAQVEYAYTNGKPVQGYFTAQSSDGLYWSGTLNDQGQACLTGLPPGSVEFNLVPSDPQEAELQEVRKQIRTLLDSILADERAQAAAHEKELAQQNILGRGISHYGAYTKGFWNGAVGLLTFAKDVVVKTGQAANLVNPFAKLNNLLQASYTSYKNGDITSGKWRQSLVDNYQDEEFRDLAELLGFDVRTLDAAKLRQIKQLAAEAYEIVAFIAADGESLDMLTAFAKDYAGAQSSVEWAEFAGGGAFEIVLTALLLAFTGGLGNVAQAGSKLRHAGWLRSLGGRFRRLGELLRHKRLNKKVKVGVDSKKKVDVDLPEGKKLSSGGAAAAQAADTPSNYGVAFFGDDNLGYYTRPNATIGRSGKTFFFMPVEDSGVVKNAADAARYTGRAPSAEKAWLNDGDIYGLSFPTDGMSVAKPTAADAGGWPHFLEGGHTAVKLGDGANSGYLVNPTREFVIPGGNPVPPGSVLFKLGPDGSWIPLRTF